MGYSRSNCKRKFTVIQTYLKKQEKSQINNPALDIRELEK